MMNTKFDATVIIWGNDNYNVLGLLRELVPYVEEVIVLVHKKKAGCATKSNLCRKYVVAKGYEEGVKYLKDFGPTIGRDAFIITTNDVLAEYVDQNYNELSQYYHLTGTKKQGLLTRMQSKTEMCRLAREIGITEPNTFMLKADTDLSRVQYPVFVKPDQKSNKNTSRRGFQVFTSKESLDAFRKEMDAEEYYNAQLLVEREEEYLMYGCRLANGEMVVPGAIIKDRWHHGRVVKDIPSTVDTSLMLRFLEQIGYYGLFSFEFGLMRGKAYFFEVNLRNDGTSLYYYLSGANMPLLWIASHFNRQNEVPQRVTTEKVFIDGIGDFPNVLSGKMSFRQWRSDIKRANIYRHWDKSDKMPFIFTALNNLPYQLLLFMTGRYRKR